MLSPFLISSVAPLLGSPQNSFSLVQGGEGGIPDSTRKVTQVAIGMLSALGTIHLGEELKVVSVEEPCIPNSYTVGEFVGMKLSSSLNFRLSCIQKVFSDGSMDCCGIDPKSTVHLSPSFICKVQSGFLEALLYHLIANDRLFLDWLATSPLDFPLEERVDPMFIRSPLDKESFAKGELVAIPTGSREWVYARVREVSFGGVLCVAPNIESIPFKILMSFPLMSNRQKTGLALVEVPCETVKKLREYPCRSVRIDSTSGAEHVIPSMQEIAPLPSVRELVSIFRSRICAEMHSLDEVSPKLYVADCAADAELLKRVMDSSNRQFQDRVRLLSSDHVGLLEEHLLSSGDTIYVCGDLHGDVVALISLLHFLQNEHLLDDNFRTLPGFSLVFLGDYVDRAPNSIQTLILLLSLRMLNPSSCFLQRGNHETAEWSKHQEPEDGSLRNFLYEEYQKSKDCFETMPLALCLTSKEECQTTKSQSQRQYVHFSHGLFSLSVDPASVLQGKDFLLSIPKQTFFPPSWTGSAKLRQSACSALFSKFHTDVGAQSPYGYLLNDIEPSDRRFPAGEGRNFTNMEIDLVRKASETKEKKICLFVRGHQHWFHEEVVERKGSSLKPPKTVAITLPVTQADPYFAMTQGLMLTVASRVRDWRKVTCALRCEELTGKYIFSRSKVEKSVYEPFTLPQASF